MTIKHTPGATIGRLIARYGALTNFPRRKLKRVANCVGRCNRDWNKNPAVKRKHSVLSSKTYILKQGV